MFCIELVWLALFGWYFATDYGTRKRVLALVLVVIAVGLSIVMIWPPEKKYPKPRELANFYQRMMDKLETLRDARSASAINFLHLSEVGIGWTFIIEGRPAPSPEERPNRSTMSSSPAICRPCRSRSLKDGI